ncbi:hypothetical protein [Haloplasma contractile]|uniref:Iron-sulfur cluster-binding oxidoreductase protein n=1 Tax=Haloplasma contractile SSD-17B TaxID=1033810 RepID=F7Q0S0_9MOLU|nr:hypothetical protein [Haloplasma contractile]ERJ11294.1 Iron-sulfur cluster-binding oxidoreductase protein [Haloplasma contractile SSD-17B]
MKRNVYNYFSLFTILLFVLGIFNILFAWLGFLCMITPFIILVRQKKNKWCQNYCPRANLFSVLFTKTKTRKTPNWLKKPWVKTFFVYYFVINLFILIWSTFLVSQQFMNAMEAVRFMIAFRIPWQLPQFIHIPNISPWAVHLSFRIYSMMFSTTVIGLLLGFLYRPRTWCTVCPVMTISNKYLKVK